MSSKIYRPGSMGAAEQKSKKRFLIGAAVVYALILCLFLVIPGYPRDWADRAGAGCLVLGFLGLSGSYALLLFGEDLFPKATWVAGLLAFLVLVLAVCTFAGFNFDLAGLAPRP